MKYNLKIEDFVSCVLEYDAHPRRPKRWGIMAWIYLFENEWFSDPEMWENIELVGSFIDFQRYLNIDKREQITNKAKELYPGVNFDEYDIYQDFQMLEWLTAVNATIDKNKNKDTKKEYLK